MAFIKSLAQKRAQEKEEEAQSYKNFAESMVNSLAHELPRHSTDLSGNVYFASEALYFSFQCCRILAPVRDDLCIASTDEFFSAVLTKICRTMRNDYGISQDECISFLDHHASRYKKVTPYINPANTMGAIEKAQEIFFQNVLFAIIQNKFIKSSDLFEYLDQIRLLYRAQLPIEKLEHIYITVRSLAQFIHDSVQYDLGLFMPNRKM